MEHFESIQSFRLQEIEGFLQPLEASQALERMGEEGEPSSLMYKADGSARAERALALAGRFGRYAGCRRRFGVSTRGSDPIDPMASR
jgi:hypothetical protein